MKVLFICSGNSARSQIAEGLFNFLCRNGSLAKSAGINPSSEVSPLAVIVLKEGGINILKARPKLLTEKLICEADRVITMGCKAEKACLGMKGLEDSSLEDWDLDDPKGKGVEEFRRLREEIKEKVEKLIMESGEGEG